MSLKPFATCLLIPLLAGGLHSVELRTSDRIHELENYHGYFPCTDCHADQESNSRPRFLVDEHDVPIEWEDSTGTVRYATFGERVSFADLLGESGLRGRRAESLMKLGNQLNARAHMEDLELAPEDSTWAPLHGGANLWCLDCHDHDDRDQLRLLNGEQVGFNESHLLCGQCHGPVLRDWDDGLHGRTNGYWNPALDAEGTSSRLLCVDCHMPHAPAFPGMQPLAAPVSRIDNLPAGDYQHRIPHGLHDELEPVHPSRRKAAATKEGAQH